MAGNEIKVAEFLYNNLGKIELHHLGPLLNLSVPFKDKILNIASEVTLKLLSTQTAEKKADIYINGHGVSIKQTGGSFPFNRLQRAELMTVFNLIKIPNCEKKIERIDKEVDDFHYGKLIGRTRPWNTFFEECDFKKLTKFLMTEGSPNMGYSNHKAEYILEAPPSGMQPYKIFTFDEYFEEYKANLFIAIRRQWIGQSSESEHKRAVGIASKQGNYPWVYKEISGQPRISKETKLRWRTSILESERRTVYLLFIEKTK